MGERDSIWIEVAYALPEQQRLIRLDVAPGTTARDAVLASGTGELFPDLDTESCPLGVFGKAVEDGYILSEGDRVEIYRPLRHDPREHRRVLAARGKSVGKNSA